MKKNVNLILAMAVCLTAMVFTSCKKDEGEPPNISFKTGGNYVSQSATVSVGDTILVGIQASKSEKKDVLKSFDASRSYDNGPSTSFVSQSLSGGDGDNFGTDLTIIARNVAGKEDYTFTVVNKDGLKNSVSLTLTVTP